MMKNNNYKEFDSLTLYVKTTLTEKIIEYYKLLGWNLVEKHENVYYEDINNLTFSRPHKIENKDELQLMQVYLEDRLNNLSKIERFKHAKSTSFGLIFGIIGVAFSVLGILNIVSVLTFLSLATSIVFTSVGGIFLILCPIFIPSIVKKERLKFEIEFTKLNSEIEEICQKASLLTGGDYGA